MTRCTQISIIDDAISIGDETFDLRGKYRLSAPTTRFFGIGQGELSKEEVAPDLSNVVSVVRTQVMSRDEYRTLREAFGLKFEAQTVPQGWKLVPIEPTNEMILALAMQTWLPQEEAEAWVDSYEQMLKTSPEYKP